MFLFVVQRAGHEPSALMEFGVSHDLSTSEAPQKFTVELSKTELAALLEKLDRVQSQLDALSSR